MSKTIEDIHKNPFQIVVPLLPKPRVLSLSLVKGCNGNCIFCPIGQKLHTPNTHMFMPMEVVNRCINEFQREPPKEIWFSENGEAILHPEFKEIVSRFRQHFPTTPFGIASNFYHMTPDRARFILNAGFTFIGVNIDGNDKASYEAVKGIEFERVMRNLHYFIKLRNSLKKPCGLSVNVLSQASYYTQIGEPEKITMPDATLATYKMLRSQIRWGELDGIFHPFALTWARRNIWKRPRQDHSRCTGLWTIGTKLFIDSDGYAYPCCLDYDSEYKYGNILNLTVDQIWNGAKRKHLVDNLLKGLFELIGKPCMWCHD